MFHLVSNVDVFMKAKYSYRVNRFGVEFLLEKRGVNLRINVPSWNKKCKDLKVLTIIFLTCTGEGNWSNRLQTLTVNFFNTSLIPQHCSVTA